MLKDMLEMVESERAYTTEPLTVRVSKAGLETIYRTSTDLGLNYDLTVELLIEYGCSALYKDKNCAK